MRIEVHVYLKMAEAAVFIYFPIVGSLWVVPITRPLNRCPSPQKRQIYIRYILMKLLCHKLVCITFPTLQ